MGLDLMSFALVKYAHLPARPYKALMIMCRTALDPGKGKGRPERLYWAGWEPLAVAMGFEVPSADDPRAASRRRKLSDYATEALKQLEKEGAIRRLVDHPGTGRRQSVHLLLGDPISPPETGGQQPPGIEGADTPESGGQQPPGKRGIRPPELGGPRTDRGLTAGLNQDTQLVVGDQPPVAIGEVAAGTDSSSRAEFQAARRRKRGAV